MNSESIRKLSYKVNIDSEPLEVRFVMKELLHLSRREISHAKAFDDGITCDGRHVNVRYMLQPGETLNIVLHENCETSAETVPTEGPLDIIYEDEDIICINKEPGIVVHPSHGHYTDSVSNRLAWYFAQKNENHVMRAVGRLDKETSGVIIFAKNRPSAAGLCHQSLKGLRTKEYLALCEGYLPEKKGIIEAPIGRVPGEKLLREVRDDGDYAKTGYEVIKEYDGYSYIKLSLFTGRTHQIRVHLHSLGHPLLGDSLYGKAIADNHEMERCALHSFETEIYHPMTGEKLLFNAKLPDDMARLIDTGLY